MSLVAFTFFMHVGFTVHEIPFSIFLEKLGNLVMLEHLALRFVFCDKLYRFAFGLEDLKAKPF